MVTFRDLLLALRKLELPPSGPIIAHASLSAFGEVHGGADTILGALLDWCQSLVMPTFTYETMVIPEIGPPFNALTYGNGKVLNRMAQFFRSDLPADRLMGAVAEALRRHPRAQRSSHPILSFAGINALQALEAQTLKEPLAPIRILVERRGWVLLQGVDLTVNPRIH